MNHLDLFSGIGGFSLAAQWAGIETIQFVEKDLFCQKVLKKHWPNVPCHDDIKTFHYDKKVDLLTGGFPCQPFSLAGKKKGIEDDRYLWPEMFRIIRECKPTFIIAENVPGIIPNLDPILEDLESEEYEFRSFLIPACFVGAPHKRERVWIVAYRNSERRDDGRNTRQDGCIEDDIKRHVEKIQQEWTQFIPEPWKIGTGEEWLSAFFPFLRDDDGLSARLHKDKRDRIKSLGNAIVPQIAYVFMRMINELDKC